jgi:hypothetical protein
MIKILNSSMRFVRPGLLVLAMAGLIQSSFGIVHPGMLHTEADFTRMRTKVTAATQPWKGSWDLLVASANSQNTWGPRAVVTINRGTSPDNSALLYNDAAAAYQNALRWKISGDTSFADNAVRILNAWGYTLTGITGNADRFLAAGLYGYEMANAAEIMRTYPGWAAADFAQFKTMMLNVFYPMNHDFLVNHNSANPQNYWANWDLCNMCTILAIGILCDDQAKIDEAVNYFKTGNGQGSITHAVPILHSPMLGQWQESGRDQEHTEMGVGLMATFCEMAWNQGIDLYGYNNKRFLAGAEYVARYNNMRDVPFAFYSWLSGASGPMNTATAVSGASRGATRNIWDMIFGHYGQRMGLYVPEVEEKANASRPDGGPQYGDHGSKFDHLGFTTLTCYRDPVPGAVVSGVYQLVNRTSGKAMAAVNNGTANGTAIEQRTLDFYANAQNWTVTSVGSGQYRILGAFSGRALDVYGLSTANGATVDLWDWNSGNNQKYTFAGTSLPWVRVTPVHSGKSIEVYGASTADGGVVDQWGWNGGSNQQWQLSAASTVRRIRLASTTNQYFKNSWWRAYLVADPVPAQDSEWRLVPSLADGVTGVSFESINYPGSYLRVRADGTLGIDAADGTAAFNNAASFRRVAGLSDAAMFSYQMWTDATRYLQNVSGAISAATAPDATTKANATFAEIPPVLGY